MATPADSVLIKESISVLRQMVRTPSFSSEEADVCNLLCEFLDHWKIKYKTVHGNIIVFNKLYDPSKPTLAMDAHMDTVKPSSTYTRDPFDPGSDPDIIYGLGSNDDGGCVATMIAVFRHFYEKEMPINLALVISREEETSGADGADYVYSYKGPFIAGEPRWVIVGEPTQMRAATSERGLLVIDAEAHGVAGHAARNEGVNALYKALEDIEILRNHKFAKVSPVMGEVKLNVTMINCGTAHNVVPDSCKYVIDVRPTNLYNNKEIVDELQSLVGSTLTPRSLVHVSSATYEGSRLIATCEKLGIETFSSPTTSNWMITRHDSIKMGPGDSARSHKADEFIYKSEIAEAFDKYIKFIETLYGDIVE